MRLTNGSSFTPANLDTLIARSAAARFASPRSRAAFERHARAALGHDDHDAAKAIGAMLRMMRRIRAAV